MIFYQNSKFLNFLLIFILITKTYLIFYFYTLNDLFFLDDDTSRYLAPGINIFNNYFFGVSLLEEKIYEVTSLPIYPLFLGFLFKIFNSYILIIVIQNFLVVYSSYLLAINVFEINKVKPTIVFFLIFNTDLLIFYYSSVFMTEVLILFFTNLLLIFLLKKKK